VRGGAGGRQVPEKCDGGSACDRAPHGVVHARGRAGPVPDRDGEGGGGRRGGPVDTREGACVECKDGLPGEGAADVQAQSEPGCRSPAVDRDGEPKTANGDQEGLDAVILASGAASCRRGLPSVLVHIVQPCGADQPRRMCQCRASAKDFFFPAEGCRLGWRVPRAAGQLCVSMA